MGVIPMSSSIHHEKFNPNNQPIDKTAAALLKTIRLLATELRPISAEQPVTMDTSLERDLGLDSLARVELLARIEKRFQSAVSSPNVRRDGCSFGGPQPAAAIFMNRKKPAHCLKETG